MSDQTHLIADIQLEKSLEAYGIASLTTHFSPLDRYLDTIQEERGG